MAKKITGIGSNPKAEGSHIHIVVKGGEALCDKRTKSLKLNRELTLENVTCTKCTRYSFYKKGIAKLQATKAAATKKAKAAQKKAPAEVDAKTTQDVIEDEATQEVIEDEKAYEAELEATHAEENAELDAQFDEAMSKDAAKIESDETIEFIDFVAIDNGKGTYAIKHIPSDKTFFDVVPANIVAFALAALNSLGVRWSEGESMPDGYIQTVRSTLTAVYTERGVDLPEHLAKPLAKTKKKKPPKQPDGVKVGDKKKVNGVYSEWNGTRWVRIQKRVLKRRRPKVQKPKRVLKRRRTVEGPKRKLKRRQKEVEQAPAKRNEIGMLVDKPPAFIYDHIKVGVHYGFLIDEMMHKFKMTEAQAKRKFKTVIRQLCTRNELTITHLIVANPKLHMYSIDSITQKATQ